MTVASNALQNYNFAKEKKEKKMTPKEQWYWHKIIHQELICPKTQIKFVRKWTL